MSVPAGTPQLTALAESLATSDPQGHRQAIADHQAERDIAGEAECAASTLIDTWARLHGPVPWRIAVRIVAIVQHLQDAERDRLLALDDSPAPDDLWVVVADSDGVNREDGPIVWETYCSKATREHAETAARAIGATQRYGKARIARLVFDPDFPAPEPLTDVPF